ncbi:MAG: hypothetical protein ABIA76_00710 [Candidatus Diapherotrites archaeon]
MKINELRPYMKKIELKFKAIEVTESRDVQSKLDSKNHKVCEAKIADDSGMVLLTLWDDTISQVLAGKNYSLENGFSSLFKNSLRINIGRFGKITEIQESIEANTENMLSKEIIPREEKPSEKSGIQ